MLNPTSRRSAFTLIELIIVITIILGLLGLVFGVAMRLGVEANKKACLTTVQILGDLLQNYPPNNPWPVSVEGHLLWDLNDDGLIDGDPAKDFPGTPWYLGSAGPTTVPSGSASLYKGCAETIGYHQRLDAKGRPKDTFDCPLRIAFSVQVYGKGGWGIWSDGPDRTPNTSDDIFSWKD